jgi:hypothetical protein
MAAQVSGERFSSSQNGDRSLQDIRFRLILKQPPPFTV